MPSSRRTASFAWPSRLRGRIAVVALASLIAPTTCLASDQPHSADLDAMIIKEAQRHGIPERLVRRVVMRESRYNPRARNHKYWGLMQISYPTARSMGFRGTPEELLNPLTNLTYAVPYLANAFIAAGKHEDAAVRLYASGYYDTARRHGLLGLMRTADSTPLQGFHDEVAAAPASSPSSGIFGALFGASDPAPALVQQPAPQSVAEAAASPPAAQASSPAPDTTRAAAVADGTSAPGDTAMVLDKSGRLEPPKRWRRDGGYTVIARGEQGDTHRLASADPQGGRSRRYAGRHAHKVTEFASAELPASAQAYAATASDAAPPPQAAIEQAVSGSRQEEGQAAAPAPNGASSQAGVSAPQTVSASTAQAETETSAAKRTHRHHVAHSRGAAHHTTVAKASVPTGSAVAAKAVPAKALAELK